jgi:hypothetical protein
MRSSRRFALALALLCTKSVHAGQDNLDSLMSLLAQRAHGHVTFVEQQYLAVLDRPVQSSGELLYDRPDRLEKRTLAPRPESLILEHGSLTIQYGRRTHVLALRDYPQIAPFVESIRAILAGDRAALEQIFQVTFDGSLDNWTLSLVPLDSKAKSVVQQIRIDGRRDELHAVEIRQADGDHSVMTINSSIAP